MAVKVKKHKRQTTLRGWKKVRDNKFVIEWASLKDGHITRVHKSLDSGKSRIWFVSYVSKRGIINRRFYHTKKAAENFAKAWMKSQPKG